VKEGVHRQGIAGGANVKGGVIAVREVKAPLGHVPSRGELGFEFMPKAIERIEMRGG
jgi:hypothetical protein